MISFSYWFLWKLVANSEAVLALVVLHPAVPADPGSCCPSPHRPISHRDTEPLSIPGLCCSGTEELAQGCCCTQLQDHQRVQRALVVYQHSFQTKSANVNAEKPSDPHGSSWNGGVSISYFNCAAALLVQRTNSELLWRVCSDSVSLHRINSVYSVCLLSFNWCSMRRKL